MPPPKADEGCLCLLFLSFEVLRAVLLSCRGDAPAGAPKGMKTNEVCDRPLETFGAATFGGSCLLVDSAAWGAKGTLTKNVTTALNKLRWDAKQSRGRSQSPLVAPAGAKSPHNHADTA